MAVHYTGGGGGLLGTLGRALGAASTFISGLQPLAPYIGAASALARGDMGGAVGSAAAPMIGNVFDKAGTPTPGVNDSLNNSLWEGQRTQFQLPDNTDYVNMRIDSMKGNVNKALDVAGRVPSQGAERALDVAGALPSAETSNYAPNESLMQALARANRGGLPAWNTDPVTGQPSRYRRFWGDR